MNVWVLALLLLTAPAEKLEGTWSMGGEAFLVLEAGGKGAMDGEPVKWSTDGKGTLTLRSDDGESETIKYTLSGDQLTFNSDGVSITLARGGAGKAVTSAPPVSKTEAAPPAAGTGDQLSQLLLSSAWCSFSYNKISGTTKTTRVQYSNNGTYSLGGQRESLSSGPNGSVYGANGIGGAGKWAVKNGVLHMSAPPETPELTPVPLTITKNSNGYPIITANGVEYSMCN